MTALPISESVPDPRPELEWELKLRLPGRLAPTARSLLDSLCRRDARFPANFVASLYYDTGDLQALHEKLASDRAKTKVRLRWYESVPGGEPLPGAFLEVKLRVGRRRAKHRLEVPIDSRWLAGASVDDFELRRLPLRYAAELRVPGLPTLGPRLVVRYRRDRWVEPHSGSRISLDTGISAPRTESRLAALAAPLPHAVVEVKNLSGVVPPRLSALWSLGARLDSFSKYGSCCLAACLGGRLEG